MKMEKRRGLRLQPDNMRLIVEMFLMGIYLASLLGRCEGDLSTGH